MTGFSAVPGRHIFSSRPKNEDLDSKTEDTLIEEDIDEE
jgi:hypothetical protein